MKKLLGIIVLGLLLQGCATTEEIAAEYDNMSEERLCIFRYKFPDYNYWMPHVKSAIKRRNIDCSPYAAEGKRQGRVLNVLEAGTSAAASTLGNQQNTSTGTTLSNGFTKVCYYSGVGGRSAITVSATAMCPQSHSHNITGQTKVCLYDGDSGQKALTVSSGSMCPARYN